VPAGSVQIDARGMARNRVHQGFDLRRDDIDRGKVETLEYDSKTVGEKRKLIV
jgi:hypothetical protein